MGKNKKATTGYSNVKNITKYIEKHPQRVAAIGSVLSVIMTAVFKIGTYIYYRGYFDQLNIPSTYIVVNYWDMVYLFLINLAVLFIVFVFSNIYITYTMELYTQRKIVSCILLQVGMILVGMLLVLVYMLIHLSSDYSRQQIWTYVKEEPGHLLFYMISLSLLFYCIIWVGGIPTHTLFGVTNSESMSKEQKKELEDKDADQTKKRVLRHPFLCFVIFMVFAVIISGVF